MRFLILLFILVIHSCISPKIPKKFLGDQYKVDCDTIASKFWVSYAAVHIFPKYVFDRVKVAENDSLIEYNISALEPPNVLPEVRTYLPKGFYIVNKKNCKLITGKIFRPK